MNDLLSKIRSAQIRAGEAAVCDHLAELELRMGIGKTPSVRTALELAGAHRPMTAIEISEDLESGLNSYGTCKLAAKTIRSQHAEIERLKDNNETLAHNANRAFDAMQGQQEEIERLTAERDSAIAAAVAAEREACAAVFAAMADSECLRSRIIALMQAAKAIRARAKP